MEITRCTKCMRELAEGERICPSCGYEQGSDRQPGIALKRNTILRGRYLIGNVIGQGGFGITYVGWDLTLEMKVAVKEYFPSGSATRTDSSSNEIEWESINGDSRERSEGMERFLKEARRMARLDDVPSIVRVRDAFGENRTAYIVMDFVEGVTLKKYLLSHGVLQYEACMRLLSPILDSLAVIHDNGFIHRDISPDNIMLRPDGSARLLDMGAAVDVAASGGHASMAVIKRNFSAPEQYVESEVLGSWTDVYAMGATIYYCMTGKVVPEALEREFKKEPLYFDPALNIPAQVVSALNGALELHAEKRIRDIREFKMQLLAAGTAGNARGEAGKEHIPAQKAAYRLKEKGAETSRDSNDTVKKKHKKKHKKKRIYVGLTVGIVLLCVFYIVTTGKKYEPSIVDGGIVIRRYPYEGERFVEFPDKIFGLPVVKLDWVCFANELGSLEEAVLPEKLQTIGYMTFYNSTNLKKIELPEGLTTIEGLAFHNTGLSEITIPSTVDRIECGADLLEIPQVNIAEGNQTYVKNGGMIRKSDGELTAFSSCREGSFIIPSEFNSIGEFAFYQTSLSEVTIPGSVRDVKWMAFSDGVKLQKVVIEDGVEELGSHSFDGCNSLSEVTIPGSMKFIGDWAFYWTSLREVEIPGSVTVVGSLAFANITELQKVVIGEGVEELASSSFAHCGSLSQITIPRSVKQIGERAFEGCKSLKTVTISKDCQIDTTAFQGTDVKIEYYD